MKHACCAIEVTRLVAILPLGSSAGEAQPDKRMKISTPLLSTIPLICRHGTILDQYRHSAGESTGTAIINFPSVCVCDASISNTMFALWAPVGSTLPYNFVASFIVPY